jgi:hypothetical protein
MSQFDDNEENIEQPTDIIKVDEVQEEETVPFLNQQKNLETSCQGRQEVFHFDCNYAPKTFKVLLTVPF